MGSMMSRKSVGWAAVVGAVLLGAGSSATAQGNASAGEGQVGFQRKAHLSPQEEVAQAEAHLARMDQASGTVRRQLERARSQRDVVKSLCLNDKLSQIDVAARSAKDRQGALQAAAQRNDAELSNHEFTIITVLKQRSEQLMAEANQCLGEEVAFVGQTQVSVDISPSAVGEETTGYPGGETALVGGPAQQQQQTAGSSPIPPPSPMSPMM